MDSSSDGHQTQTATDQLESELIAIENILGKHVEKLEESVLVQSEEEAPPEELPVTAPPALVVARRIIAALKRSIRTDEFILKENSELKKQLKEQQFVMEEVEMERDVLLQQVHAYLETNSSLRVRLEEQRCHNGVLQAEVNANLELRIKALENEKEKLSDLNLEKEKEIRKMRMVLEQTAKCLRSRETEVLNWRNEEKNSDAGLKADLQKALEEKANLEQKLATFAGRWGGKKPREALKRSRSMGDVSRRDPNTTQRSASREPARNPNAQGLENPRREEGPPHPRGRPKSPPVHTQLAALRRGLANVTDKLDALKRQLVSSGVIAEETCRRLKRKAKPPEEEEEVDAVSEEQKSGFRNLKNILQDARNLNAKLENLREEKQKMMDGEKRGTGALAEGEKRRGVGSLEKP